MPTKYYIEGRISVHPSNSEHLTVSSLAISKQNMIACAVRLSDAESAIYIYDNNFQLIKTIKENVCWVTSMCFSPDGSLLVTAASGQNIKIWNTKTFNLILDTQHHLATYVDSTPSYVNAICFNQEGTLLIFAAANTLSVLGIKGQRIVSSKTVYIENKLTESQILSLGEYAYDKCFYAIAAISLHPNGTEIALGGFSEKIKILDLASLAEKDHFIQPNFFSCPQIKYSPDGQYLWLLDNSTLYTFITKNYYFDTPNVGLFGNEEEFYATFTPNNNTFLTQAWDYVEDNSTNLYEWSLPEGEVLRSFESEVQDNAIEANYELTALVMSPDGNLVASAAVDAPLRIWNDKGTLLVSKLYDTSQEANLLPLS